MLDKSKIITLEPELATIFAEHFSKPDANAIRTLMNADAYGSEQAQAIAKRYFDMLANPEGHPCYHNDAAFVGLSFDLGPETTHDSAVFLIENGMAGYFEERTHAGFELFRLLRFQMRVMGGEEPERDDFFRLPPAVLRKVAAKYGLSYSAVDELPLLVGNPARRMYSRLSDERIRELSRHFEIERAELGDIAEKICRWGIAKQVERVHICDSEYLGHPDSEIYGGGGPLAIPRIKHLVDTYLEGEPLERVAAMVLKFESENPGVGQEVSYMCEF